MSIKLRTVDDFMKEHPEPRFQKKEDVLAWALRGYAKLIVSDSEDSDKTIWNVYRDWIEDIPRGWPGGFKDSKGEPDFYVLKIVQDEFEDKIGINKILAAEPEHANIDMRGFKSVDDAYLPKRIMNAAAESKELKLDSINVGYIADFDMDAVRALLCKEGLQSLSAEGCYVEGENYGTGYEDKVLREMMEETKSKVPVYNHNNRVDPKLSVRRDLEKNAGAQTPSRSGGREAR